MTKISEIYSPSVRNYAVIYPNFATPEEVRFIRKEKQMTVEEEIKENPASQLAAIVLDPNTVILDTSEGMCPVHKELKESLKVGDTVLITSLTSNSLKTATVLADTNSENYRMVNINSRAVSKINMDSVREAKEFNERFRKELKKDQNRKQREAVVRASGLTEEEILEKVEKASKKEVWTKTIS